MKVQTLKKPGLHHVGLVAATLLVLGCNSNQSKPEEAEPAPVPVSAKAPVTATAKEPVPCTPQANTKPKTSKKGKTAEARNKAAEADTNCAPVPASAPAAEAKEPGSAVDLSKNKPVTDSSNAKSGEGVRVKGIDGWEGEISGVPAPGTKFTRLKIGMPLKQVTDLIGQPTDQGAYVTGKAFIPFYFGSDKSRWEMAYKGQGRLIFANQAGFGTGHYLIWIIHNRDDNGYR